MLHSKSSYFYFLGRHHFLITLILFIGYSDHRLFVHGSPYPSSSSSAPLESSSSSSSPSLSLSNSNGSSMMYLVPSASSVDLANENVPCERRNSSCDYCVKSKHCFYCTSTSSCLSFNLRLSGCPSVNEIAYGTCFVHFKTIAIAFGSLIIVIVLTIMITWCCCCRCQRKRSGWEVDNQKENLTMRGSVIRDNAFARREERQKRVDEIKRKYGIPDKKYNRF